jgi:type IV secretion system protein TrbF
MLKKLKKSFTGNGAGAAPPSEAAPAGRANAVAANDAYALARLEWNERYGSYIARARVWRLFAFLMAATALVLAIGLLYMAGQQKVVPYVVEVDRLGQAVRVQAADVPRATDPRVVKAMLARFIGDARSVIGDGIAQRQAIDRVYAMLANGSRGVAYLNEFYQRENPFTRAQTQLISIDITSTLPQTDKTWLVEWEETARNTAGQVLTKTRWKAFLTVAFNPPSDEQQIRINPLGVFITDANWAQTL